MHQRLHVTHFLAQGVHEGAVESQQPRHVESELPARGADIELNARGEAARILRAFHAQARVFEKLRIFRAGGERREFHEAQKALRFGVVHGHVARDPIGERNRAAGPDEPHGLADEARFVGDIAPGVLPPHEIRAGVIESCLAGVGKDKLNLCGASVVVRALPADVEDLGGGVDAGHVGDSAEPQQKPHPRARATAQIHPATAR